MINLIIFGPPGAGKGTQAELIAKKYKLAHLSSGHILRQELQNKEFGAKIKKYQDSGKLVPDSLVIQMVEKNALANLNRGLIFDGYPRSLKQAKSLEKFFSANGIALDAVLNIKLSSAEASSRILLRAEVSGRSDDNAKTVKERFRVYKAQTEPILEYYQKRHKIINIDGRPEIKTIFSEINKEIKALKKKK
jgi:adenylate kinase